MTDREDKNLGHRDFFLTSKFKTVSTKFIGPSDQTDKVAIGPICALSSRTGLSDVRSGTMYVPQDFRR